MLVLHPETRDRIYNSTVKKEISLKQCNIIEKQIRTIRFWTCERTTWDARCSGGRNDKSTVARSTRKYTMPNPTQTTNEEAKREIGIKPWERDWKDRTSLVKSSIKLHAAYGRMRCSFKSSCVQLVAVWDARSFARIHAHYQRRWDAQSFARMHAHYQRIGPKSNSTELLDGSPS